MASVRLPKWLRKVRLPEAVAPQKIRDEARVARLVELTNGLSQPNINALSVATRNLDILALNVKAMGYALARQLGESLPSMPATTARHVGLGSKLSTQADIESDWFAHWCRELGIPLIYHRKLWEYAYLLQALHENGQLRAGARGLGFGFGIEPTGSYFASLGIDVMATDLSVDDPRAKDWATNNEYAATIEQAYYSHLVDRDRFMKHVSHRNVDMNDIPADLLGYDFCWSICAFEHLGSIEKGLAFIENAMKTLRPGGTAVHTTEFNINSDGPTIDNWVTVLFQRKHIEALADRLTARGHKVATLNFDTGNQPLDQFIDLPPWHDNTLGTISAALGQPLHLKVASDGFIATCIGLTITKAE